MTIDANQRILFLCDSLVPGKAGVGDYCRRLAAELMRAGGVVQIVSVYDPGAEELTIESQPELDLSVPVVRIPETFAVGRKFACLQEAIRAFSPSIISVQYVPYSFSKYGVPLDFIRRLKQLNHGGRWHVMFHELWITKLRPGHLPKDLAVAWLQKQSVKLLYRILKPAVVHTNLPVHQDRLQSQSVTALPLPLFTNIHPSPEEPIPTRDSEEYLRIGYFSQLIVERTIPFLLPLDKWVKESGRRGLEIVLLGCGERKATEATSQLKQAIPDCRIVAPGFLPVAELSAYLHTLKLGITPVDYHLLGKSGTVAAFLAHKVPVAAPFVTENGSPSFVPNLSEVIFQQFTPERFAAASAAISEFDVELISARRIAGKFGNDLGIAHP